MAIKTYVLLEHTIPSAPVYIQATADQRIKIGARPLDHAYLQLTYTEGEKIADFNPDSKTYGEQITNPSNGKNRTIRLKLTSNTIFQDEQIKEGLLANIPFTQAERDSVKFINGVLVTKNIIVQKFLESSPQHELFSGQCSEIVQPLYRVFDRSVAVKKSNKLFLKRVAAANRIASVSLQEGQELMIKLNGSFFKTPDTLEDVQEALVSYLDDADDEGLDRLIEKDNTVDEEIVILIGKAVKSGIISFDVVPNQVVKIDSSGKFINLKEISSTHDAEERRRYFAEFITSEAGKLLLGDLKKDIKAKEKAAEKKFEAV